MRVVDLVKTIEATTQTQDLQGLPQPEADGRPHGKACAWTRRLSHSVKHRDGALAFQRTKTQCSMGRCPTATHAPSPHPRQPRRRPRKVRALQSLTVLQLLPYQLQRKINDVAPVGGSQRLVRTLGLPGEKSTNRKRAERDSWTVPASSDVPPRAALTGLQRGSRGVGNSFESQRIRIGRQAAAALRWPSSSVRKPAKNGLQRCSRSSSVRRARLSETSGADCKSREVMREIRASACGVPSQRPHPPLSAMQSESAARALRRVRP